MGAAALEGEAEGCPRGAHSAVEAAPVGGPSSDDAAPGCSKAGHGSHALHRAAGGPAGRGERRHDNRGKAGQLVRRATPGGLVGAAGLQAASICSVEINELNEEAIELIFTFLPAEDRRSAAAVCRLWRRVHNSSTKLWGSVLLSGERLVQAAASAAAAGPVGAWLAARLGAMRAVRLWSPAHPLESFASSLAQLLSRENRVQSFSYMCTDVSVSRLLGELQRLTSLQQLDVLSPFTGAGGQGLVVWARELIQLKPLRNLLSLQLHAREIRGSLPPALFRCLNRLQHLSISAKCRLPAAVVRQLSGLRSLELHGASMDATAAQAASALQHLSRLCISVRACGPLQEPAGEAPASPGSGQRSGSEGSEGSKSAAAGIVQRWQEHPVWGQLPLLARLQVLAVGAELPAAGGECEAEPAVLPYDWLEGGVPDGIMDCSSLTHLVLPVALTHLPELVPGQLARLASLDLTHSIVEALPPSWCCHLQSLSRLVLNGAALAGSRLPPEFAALHSLRSLELRACRLAALPACVAALPGLTSLDLGVNRLTDLPDGPYLRRLRHLSLRGNALPALPPALSSAAELETLDCGENLGLGLRPDDVESILAPLPRLRLLVLSRQPAGFGFGPYISAATGAAWDTSSVAALMHLARRLPKLSVELERTLPPYLPPPAADQGSEDAEAASAAP